LRSESEPIDIVAVAETTERYIREAISDVRKRRVEADIWRLLNQLNARETLSVSRAGLTARKSPFRGYKATRYEIVQSGVESQGTILASPI
jgi:hypothetical protein